jgi:hypothetical protein
VGPEPEGAILVEKSVLVAGVSAGRKFEAELAEESAFALPFAVEVGTVAELAFAAGVGIAAVVGVAVEAEVAAEVEAAAGVEAAAEAGVAAEVGVAAEFGVAGELAKVPSDTGFGHDIRFYHHPY